MILLWGLDADRPLRSIRTILEEQEIRTIFVDQRKTLDIELDFFIFSTIRGTLRVGDEAIDLGAVTAAYLRPYDSRRLPPISPCGQGSREWQHAVSLDAALWSWAELTSSLVVNRPRFMGSNFSKPYQLEQIRSLGLEVPETMVTTDPSAVLSFQARHGDLVYKSVSSVRSIVSRLRHSDCERLADVAWCPTQFQPYIAGVDYRVHVVGEQIFCSEIRCEADDYRYACQSGKPVRVQFASLPQSIADRCRALAALQQLSVAGIDLRCSPSGTWYCFEVNPSPAFSYYDSDQRIARAVAGLLASTAAR